jgi:hypothetical protein
MPSELAAITTHGVTKTPSTATTTIAIPRMIAMAPKILSPVVMTTAYPSSLLLIGVCDPG